ncbi:MAG: mannitol-1-phosphate 5-dehydrogenase [Spirochaetota bacterium]
MKKVVQFGAGKIGRGFLAELFNQSGYEIVFVDIDAEVLSNINNKGAYIIKIVGASRPLETGSWLVKVNNIKGISVSDVEKVTDEIANAGLVATAVGTGALKSIAPLIAKGLEKRAALQVGKPLNIIICENLLNASKILKEYILEELQNEFTDYVEKHLGLVESVVSRMVPIVEESTKKKDPLGIITEEYAHLPVDRNGFKGRIPKIKGTEPLNNFTSYVERKLFIHNTAHALCSYWGYLRGYKYIFEAVLDNKIENMLHKALLESGRALCKKHGFSPKSIQDYIDDLLKRFKNRALKDSVFRGAYDPIRKLGLNERLVGAANLAL